MAETKLIYGNMPETELRESNRKSADGVNHVLLGTILKILDTKGDWLKVDTLGRGKGGWVHKDDVRDTPILKVFFVDVGQGDGAIVESPEGIMLIDGGPHNNFLEFMQHRSSRILKSGKKVEIKAMVVSHPDYDHFNGLTQVLKDKRFKSRKVIFVHGCFWHRHAGYPKTATPKTRVTFWARKFEETVNRDKRSIDALRSAGWEVLVIWECQIKDRARLSKTIAAFLKGGQPGS